MSACCDCESIDQHFGPARAAAELDTYARRGPPNTTRLILRILHELPVQAETLLDIGAGVGILHHELLGAGVRTAVHVEAAHAYLDAARAESTRRGHAERVRFLDGDFLSLAGELDPADLVTLDRVVCCYRDFEPLVRQSVAKARRYYAISYPRDLWYVRAHTMWQNLRRRRAGNPFRTFLHPPERIRALIHEGGVRLVNRRTTLVWEVLLWVREDAA
jgi:SAM-dependent methyltransferase